MAYLESAPEVLRVPECHLQVLDLLGFRKIVCNVARAAISDKVRAAGPPRLLVIDIVIPCELGLTAGAHAALASIGCTGGCKEAVSAGGDGRESTCLHVAVKARLPRVDAGVSFLTTAVGAGAGAAVTAVVT